MTIRRAAALLTFIAGAALSAPVSAHCDTTKGPVVTAVRALGPHAKALADRYFFETLVRIHRAGEGAAFTGLTDGEPEPIIAATDRALASGGGLQRLPWLLTGLLASAAIIEGVFLVRHGWPAAA